MTNTNVTSITRMTLRFDDEDWRSRLIVMDGTTKPYSNMANVSTVLRYSPEWKGQVWQDTLGNRRMRRIVGKDRPWSDADSLELLQWIQVDGDCKAMSKAALEDGIAHAADMNKMNPLTEYLNSLEWDGESRISSWLTDYLGVDSTALTSAMGRAWLISAVARAYEPGCQADHCLILEGAQGLKKSTLLRELAGEEWHAEHSAMNLADKDAAISCNGKWIIEFSELGAVKTNKVETVKSFLTRRSDHYRPPYQRYAVSVPRTCVFAGTTNEEHYLEDQTGNRRYWPVKCFHSATKQLGRDRNQLWAEAVAMYQTGEQWYLVPEMERLAAIQQQRRVTGDPWLDDFRVYLRDKIDVSIAEVLTEKLKKNTGEITTGDSRRAAACMRLLNWESYNTTDGRCLRRWRPVKINRRANLNPDRAVID